MFFFFFVCGEQTFTSQIKGYENIVCQCQNCGNISGRVIKSRPFFTFCFIPIIPYTISGFKEIYCHICRFRQPLQQRPDVTAMAKEGEGGGGQGQPPPYQGYGQQPYQGQQPARYG